LASGRPSSSSRSALDVLHHRDWPSALVSSDRDAKPVLIVDEELIDRTGFSRQSGRRPLRQFQRQT
jgi:hypothetical protein